MSDDSALWLDGKPYTVDDLTFREQRKLRDLIRELAPGEDVESASEADFIPAFIAVIKQRDDPGFSVEQALDFRPADLARPQKRAAKK